MYFQELFIWLEREHQLSQLIDAPRESCWLLAPLWASMVALGGSWRKYMRTIVLSSKTNIFHSPGLFCTSTKRYILDHTKRMKTIVFCRLLDPRPENHHIINFGPQGPLRPQGPQISEVMFFSHVRTPKFITPRTKVRGRISEVMQHWPSPSACQWYRVTSTHMSCVIFLR